METKSAFQSAIARPAIDVDPSAGNCRISLRPVLRLKDIVVLSLSPGGFEGSSQPWGVCLICCVFMHRAHRAWTGK